jgi:hypothetical protein
MEFPQLPVQGYDPNGHCRACAAVIPSTMAAMKMKKARIEVPPRPWSRRKSLAGAQ